MAKNTQHTMAAMKIRGGAATRERRPLLQDSDATNNNNNRPRQQQQQDGRTAAAAVTGNNNNAPTMRLRRRWPRFSSSTTAITHVTDSTASSATDAATTPPNNNNNSAAAAVPVPRIKPPKERKSSQSRSRPNKKEQVVVAKSSSATTTRKSQKQKPQASWRSTSRRQPPQDPPDAEAVEADPPLDAVVEAEADPPAVSFSVSSTTTTTTNSSSAMILQQQQSTSTSTTTNTFSSSQFSSTRSQISTMTHEFDVPSDTWESHEEKKTEDNSTTTTGGESPYENFFDTTRNTSSLASHSTLTASEDYHHQQPQKHQQQQKQQRQGRPSMDSGTSTITSRTSMRAAHATNINNNSFLQNSPAHSNGSSNTNLSSSTTSTEGENDKDEIARVGLNLATTELQRRFNNSHNNNNNIHHNSQTTQSKSKTQSKSNNNVMRSDVKAMLRRPLGRHTLPVSIARQWVVEVSSAEWDDDEKRWKYRILVQSRRQQKQQQSQQQTQNDKLQQKSSYDSSLNEEQGTSSSMHSSGHATIVNKQQGPQSLTTAFTWRSLADFLWLEQALRLEFQGSLLLPILTIALGKPADDNLKGMPVESEKLRDWLSDALNGVRGQGEWIMPMPAIPPLDPPGHHDDADERKKNSSSLLVLQAESMEAFLYRNAGPLEEEQLPVVTPPLPLLGSSSLNNSSSSSSKNHHALLTTPTSYMTPRTSATTTHMHSHSSIRGDHYSPPRQQQYRRRGGRGQQGEQQQHGESLVQQIIYRPLDFLQGELCTGPTPHGESSVCGTPRSHQDDYSAYYTSGGQSTTAASASHRSTPHATPGRGGGSQQRRPRRIGAGGGGLPMDMFNCSSRALSSAPSLEVMDSFAADSSAAFGMTSSPRFSSHLAIHSEVVEAERDLVLNYRASALRVMEKMQGLLEAEENIGLAWKRLAVSLSNLFGYEKDVEHAKLGDLKRTKKEYMPYRKVTKHAVDECLRVLARQKVERAVPALRSLQAMVTAYVADLSAVEPSVEVYLQAIQHLSLLDYDSLDDANQSENIEDVGLGSKRVSSWDRAKEAMRALVEKERAAQHIAATNVGKDVKGREDAATFAQRKAYQQRVLHHERALCNALTTMCAATPMRVARMSWCYWNTEATQCAALHSAAVDLRTKISIANKDSVSKMLKRHLKEEKEDHMAELALIQRMVNLGNDQKFSQLSPQAKDPTSSVDGDSQVEITTEELGEQQEKAMLRDQALLLARERVGRWDSKLGLAVMRAIGIEDPNVRVEETTRDLRLIRKYAIGLRECLSRCIDAVDRLRAAFQNGGAGKDGGDDDDDSVSDSDSEKSKRHIRDVRKSYLTEVAKLFSGQFIDRDDRSGPKRSMPSTSVLTKAGVDMSDPFGWSVIFDSERQGKSRRRLTQGRVGDLALAYSESRDHQTEWLLTSLSELLNDYYNRVETVEGYVYMECVGIQLEKHFSEKRSKALSAFEKKTDITTAINIATRKRMAKIVIELQSKLDMLGPEVSHTLVKETKEVHLESKAIKGEIHALAVRRLTRARETSTERAIALMALWAKEEEGMAATELKALGEAMAALERLVAQEDMNTDHHFL